jgi:glucan-binding YG repeat protein
MSSAWRHKAVLMTLLPLLNPVCAPRAGEVYKSIDAEGHVVYSDRAPTSAAQKSVVRVDRPAPTEVARNAKEQAILQVEDSQRRKEQSVVDAKKAQAEHNRQVQCDGARNRYYSLKDARRIFQRDAEGNRVYYNDADADAKREEARQAMVTACEE